MDGDELAPMDDESALVMRAEAACHDAAFEGECVRRVPELADHPDFRKWCDWIQELDEMDGDGLADDLTDFDEHAAGAAWIEDERGAVFVPWWSQPGTGCAADSAR